MGERALVHAPPPLTSVVGPREVPVMSGDNLLLSAQPGYHRASSSVQLRHVPRSGGKKAGAMRPAPQLPLHVVASELGGKTATSVATSLTPAAASRWALAWSGAKPSGVDHRDPPMMRPWVPSPDGKLEGQAAAGSLMMRVALHRPAAFEKIQDYVDERRRREREEVARRRAEQRK